MRILFVYKGVEWLGIEYLSSVLKRAGHTTDLIFDHGLDGTFYIRRKKKNYQPIIDGIKRFQPDLIAMHMVRWCPHPVSQTLRDWFGDTGVDPEYMAMVEAAESDGGEATFPGGHVIPAHGREELYRFMISEMRRYTDEMPIVLCRETPEMWKLFMDELRTDPAMCGCGTLPRG